MQLLLLCVKWPPVKLYPQCRGTVVAVAVLPCAHREAKALVLMGAVRQLSSLLFPETSLEGLIDDVIYPGSKLGCILIHLSALQGCMTRKGVVISALAMSGVLLTISPKQTAGCSYNS